MWREEHPYIYIDIDYSVFHLFVIFELAIFLFCKVLRE